MDLKDQESTDVVSTLHRAQTLLEALMRSFEASRLRPKSCQGTGGGSTPASGHPGLGFCSREKQLTKAAEKQSQSIVGREVSIWEREYGDEGRAVRPQDNVSVTGGPSTLSALGACTAAWIPAVSQPGAPQGEAQLPGRKKHFREPHQHGRESSHVQPTCKLSCECCLHAAVPALGTAPACRLGAVHPWGVTKPSPIPGKVAVAGASGEEVAVG